MAALSVFAAAVLDRAAKSFLVAVPRYELTVVPGWLSFELVANPGGPLGLPLPTTLAVVLAGGVVVAGLLAASAIPSRQMLVWLVALGVASNTYDRVTLGYVVDTLRFQGGLAFNFADVYITAALVALAARELSARVRRRSSPELAAAAVTLLHDGR